MAGVRELWLSFLFLSFPRLIFFTFSLSRFSDFNLFLCVLASIKFSNLLLESILPPDCARSLVQRVIYLNSCQTDRSPVI